MALNIKGSFKLRRLWQRQRKVIFSVKNGFHLYLMEKGWDHEINRIVSEINEILPQPATFILDL